MPCHAFPIGRVITRVTPSIGRKNTPNVPRNTDVDALPCRSSVIKMIEVRESNAIARFRFAEITDTIVYQFDLVE